MKFCRTCKTWMSLSEFGLCNQARSKLQPSCKSCRLKSMSKLRRWYKERKVIIQQILLRYPCSSCGELQVKKTFIRQPESELISNRTIWKDRETLIEACRSQVIQCYGCLGRKPTKPTHIEPTEDEIEALLASHETRLSKALGEGRKSKRQALKDQFKDLIG